MKKSCLTAAGKPRAKYWRVEKAHEAIASINESKPGCQLEPYWCDAHMCWHIGSAQIQKREYTR